MSAFPPVRPSTVTIVVDPYFGRDLGSPGCAIVDALAARGYAVSRDMDAIAAEISTAAVDRWAGGLWTLRGVGRGRIELQRVRIDDGDPEWGYTLRALDREMYGTALPTLPAAVHDAREGVGCQWEDMSLAVDDLSAAVASVVEDAARSRASWVRAKLADAQARAQSAMQEAQQAARDLVGSGMTEVDAAEAVGLSRMTVRKALGK